ncbi:hypothetical protein BAUCODRAFT_467808 [Baudoinia panamericana UAMH 10762]|uniref:Uncharacterized protein n=1 Tax=Baudoinia panamericana (strain UAMH 10762) TaxID=717646 RepID=M2MHY3_BAUPA|nr:uncharacterized protein BAUCODRAFT_467808 [Baudoinia panamericana UAMH 10762]EMC96251.1 hypothetical protein BAUCODRAFT_467808 [Baudoinia panamericana UAMH 10762]
MPPKKKQPGELQFVVTTNPFEASSAVNRRRIRSQAALQSWPERRKRTFQQLDESSIQSGTFHSRTYAPGPAAEAPLPNLEAPGNETAATATVLKLEHPRPSLPTAPPSANELPTLGAADAPSPCTRSSTPESPCRCHQCHPARDAVLRVAEREILKPTGRRRPAEASNHNTDLTLLTPPSSPKPPFSGMADPFNCYPVPYKPLYDAILHHMLTVFAPRGWPALKITTKEGLKWEQFMTQHALADPALFYVRLLFASGDLVRLKVLQPEVSHWLRIEAIKAINEALQDPQRATSIPLILAVGRIAFNEFLYGDRNAANTIHRPAQQRMLRIRGGLKALDTIPELVKRLMRLTDTIMAKQGGTERFIEDDDTSKNFSMEASLNVLEKWAPKQGQELRRKISISDLVND